jgi:DNA polymerase-3 subunit delta
MPVYFFWGEDDFAMTQEINTLKDQVIDPSWAQFNYDKLSGDKLDSLPEAFLQVMTPVFGRGERLVWVEETTITQFCSDDLFSKLKQTINQILPTSHLLLTSSKKPDSRLKSTKLLQKNATIKQFSPLNPWQTEAIAKKVAETTKQKGVNLTKEAIELLAKSVGNNSRLLWNELDKLWLYQENQSTPITPNIVKELVNVSNQNSLELASAILAGNIDFSLELVNNLININEPALRIVATLVGQFRTWTMVKLMLETKAKQDKEIAEFADLGNPKRLYFLRKEISHVSAQQLLTTLPLLFELELGLKRGANPVPFLETKVIELASIFRA